jgi:hypothetical protein
MLYALARAVSLGLPWLAVAAISATMAYGISTALTSGVSTVTRANESVPIVTARPIGAEASNGGNWSVYVGPNCWLPDPSGLETCGSQSTVSR